MRNKLAIFGFLVGIAIVICLAVWPIEDEVSPGGTGTLPPTPPAMSPGRVGGTGGTLPPSPPASTTSPSPRNSPRPPTSIPPTPPAMSPGRVGGTGGTLPPSPPATTPMPSGQIALVVPPTSMAIVDEIVTNLEWGNIAFETPKKMQFEEPKIIELLLSSTKSVRELQSSLKSHEQIESARIQISNRMEADLSGQGFKIEALVPQEQAVYRGKTTQWKWEVTPTKDGNQNLYLTLSAIINVSNQKVPLVIRTFDKTIKVDVSVGQQISTFVSGNWQWLWASILVPISPFIWKWYKKKRDKNQPPNNPGAAD